MCCGGQVGTFKGDHQEVLHFPFESQVQTKQSIWPFSAFPNFLHWSDFLSFCLILSNLSRTDLYESSQADFP